MTTKHTRNSTCATVVFNTILILIIILICIWLLFVGIGTGMKMVPPPVIVIEESEKLKPGDNSSGYYSYLGDGQGKMVCTSITSCLHETGHHLDHLLEMPSMSPEWELSVQAFINICEEIDNLFCSIKDFTGVNGNPLQTVTLDGQVREWGGYGELYAHIYDISKTNMQEIPDILLLFYKENWK